MMKLHTKLHVELHEELRLEQQHTTPYSMDKKPHSFVHSSEISYCQDILFQTQCFARCGGADPIYETISQCGHIYRAVSRYS